MYEFSVLMGLADFVPVALFGVSAVLLQRDLYKKMPKYAFACFAAGTINAFLAGFFKALWKLLYALGVCDFQMLATMFLPTQSLGLLLAGLGLLLMLAGRKSSALAVAPPLFKGTFLFIGMMVAGLGAICACLSVLAVKLKKRAWCRCSSSASSATWAWAISPRGTVPRPPATGSSRASTAWVSSCCCWA